jgi:hypothetical protein
MMNLLKHVNLFFLILPSCLLNISLSQTFDFEITYLSPRTSFFYLIDLKQENFQIESFTDSTITYCVYSFVPSDSMIEKNKVEILTIDDTIKINFNLVESSVENSIVHYYVCAVSFTISRPIRDQNVILNNKVLTSNKYGLPEILVYRRDANFKISVERIIYFVDNQIAFEEIYDESNRLIKINQHEGGLGFKRSFLPSRTIFYNPFGVL